MRSWSLYMVSAAASLSAVLSLVLLFSMSLYFYQGDFFGIASARNPSRGMEVLLYLIPLLFLLAFFSYFLIFSILKKPKAVIETAQMFKVTIFIFLLILSCLFLILCLEGTLYRFLEMLAYFCIVYALLLVPIFIGLMTGNTLYLYLSRVCLKREWWLKLKYHQLKRLR